MHGMYALRARASECGVAGGGGGQLRVIGAHLQLAPGPPRFGWPQTRWCLEAPSVSRRTLLHGMSGSSSCDVAAPLTGTIAVAAIATFLVRVRVRVRVRITVSVRGSPVARSCIGDS